MWVTTTTNSNSGDDNSKYQDECDGKDVYFYLDKFCTAVERTPYLTEVCYYPTYNHLSTSPPSYRHIVHIGLWYAHQKKSIQTEADRIRFWKKFSTSCKDKVKKDLRKWNISIKWQKSGTNGTSEKNVRCLFGWDYDKDHGVLKTSLPSARTGCYTLLDAAQKSNWENVKSWQNLSIASGSGEDETHRRYNAKYKILRLNKNKFDDNNQTHMDYDYYKTKFKDFTFHNTYQSEDEMGYFNYESDKPKLLFKTVKSDIFPIRNGVFRILKDDDKIGSSTTTVKIDESGIWWFGANGLMHRLKRKDFNTKADKCSVIDEKNNIKTIQMSLLHDRYEPSEMWYDHTVLITEYHETKMYHLVRFDKTMENTTDESDKDKYYGCVQNDKTVSRDPNYHWEHIVDGVYKWSDPDLSATSYYLIYSNTSPPQIINLKSITPTISNTVSISSDDPFNKTFYDRTKKEFEKEWFHNVLLLPEDDAATTNNKVFYYNYVTGKFLGFNNSSNSDLEWNETEDNCLWKYGKKSNYGFLYYFCGDSGTHTCSRKRVVHSVMDPLMVLGEGKFSSNVSHSTITVSPVDPPYLHCNSDDSLATGIQNDIVAVSGISIDSNSIQADFKKNSFLFKVNAAINNFFRLAISNCSAGVYKLTDSITHNSIEIRLKPKKSLSDVFKIHTIPEGIQLFDTTTADDNFYTTLDDVCWIRTKANANVFYAPALNKQINITNENASNKAIYDNSILPTVWKDDNPGGGGGGGGPYTNLVTGTQKTEKPDRPIDWIQTVNTTTGKITYKNGANNSIEILKNPALSTRQQKEHVEEVVKATNDSLPIGWDATVETPDLQVKYNKRTPNWTGYDSAAAKWKTPKPQDTQVVLPNLIQGEYVGEPTSDYKRKKHTIHNYYEYKKTDGSGSTVQCPDLPESTIVDTSDNIWQRRLSAEHNGYYYYTIDSVTPQFSWNKPT